MVVAGFDEGNLRSTLACLGERVPSASRPAPDPRAHLRLTSSVPDRPKPTHDSSLHDDTRIGSLAPRFCLLRLILLAPEPSLLTTRLRFAPLRSQSRVARAPRRGSQSKQSRGLQHIKQIQNAHSNHFWGSTITPRRSPRRRHLRLLPRPPRPRLQARRPRRPRHHPRRRPWRARRSRSSCRLRGGGSEGGRREVVSWAGLGAGREDGVEGGNGRHAYGSGVRLQ